MLKEFAANAEDPDVAIENIAKKVGVSAAGRKYVQNFR